MKTKYFPPPPPDVYIDFNVFYDEYNLPETHTYDTNLKYKVKKGMKNGLLNAVTEAINRDYYMLYELLESSNDIQQGVKFSRLFDDFQRLSKRGNRDIKLKGHNIIITRPLARDFNVATIIDPSIKTTIPSDVKDTRPLYLQTIGDPKVYVPHRSSNVAYKKFGDIETNIRKKVDIETEKTLAYTIDTRV